MEHSKTFYTSDRRQWREWLAVHFEKEKEIWFVFPLKESGEKGLSYNDAVEEALCFGWIDRDYCSTANLKITSSEEKQSSQW